MPGETDPVVTPPLVSAIGAELRSAHRENVAVTHDSMHQLLNAVLEEHEAELSAMVRPMLSSVADHPDTPAAVRDVLHAITAPEHQTQFFTALFAVRAIVDQFVFAAIAPLVQEVSNKVWPLDPNIPASPADAALGVLRNNISHAEGAAIAETTGIGADAFKLLVDNTGEPPGIGTMQEALRRDIVKEDRFTRAVLQSRVRDEWVDVLLKLRYAPPPIGEVLAGAVQNHLDKSTAQRMVAEAGISPDNFGWLYETHGRPPGVVELGELVNRGEMLERDWQQAIRESDIKDKYIPALNLLRRRIPPERTIVSAIRQGVLPAADGIRKLMELGFDHADAAMLASEATATKHQATRDLAQGQIVRLYSERLMSRADAHTHLMSLGFDTHEADFLLALADHARDERFTNAAINRVHAQYVGHRIDAKTAQSDLQQLGLEPTARADLLKLWTDERAANVRVLSVAELQGAVRRQLITHAEFRDAIVALGYSLKDVPILYGLAYPPTQTPPRF